MAELNKNQTAERPTWVRPSLSGTATGLPGWKEHITFWTVAVFGTLLDLWSKSFVFEWLQQRPERGFSVIDGFFHFVMALNDGAAFGIARGQRYVLIAVSVIALTVILCVFLFGKIRQKLVYISLGFFAAGVSGNLYDRMFNDGLVRDFIDIVYWPGRHWPAFNIADSMLCLAVGLFIFSSLFTEKSGQKRVRQHR